MFKNLKPLLLVLALGVFAQAATAVSLHPSQGQVLIFPYYNVNNGYITAFNIINTTESTKAVKLRFRESDTSNDVLDFNVYMSPRDVFTVGLSRTSRNGVLLRTNDSTCTHPTIPREGVLFRNVYDTVSLADVREGYLEVIEMGEVSNSIVAAGVEHVDGVPRDCSVIETAWQTGAFTQGGASANLGAINVVNSKAGTYPNKASETGFYGDETVLGLTPPTGGLVGSSILVDTVHITGFSGEPIAINNYSTKAQHYLSSDENFYLLPSLASGNVLTTDKGNTWSTVARDWGLDDKNVLPRVSVPSGINPMPVADAISVTHVANQYFLGATTATDWVLATPMRKHGVFNNYSYHADAVNYAEGIDIPVHGEVGDAKAPYGYWEYLEANDVNAKFVYWDREESLIEPVPGDFSPPLPTEDTYIPFSSEVNILTFNRGFNSQVPVLGSDNAQEIAIASDFVNGWGSFDFSGYDLADLRYTADWVTTSALSAPGVPISGFMAARGSLQSGNIGETFPHFSKRVK